MRLAHGKIITHEKETEQKIRCCWGGVLLVDNFFYFFKRIWHKLLMKRNYSLYEESKDPIERSKLFKKASFHANKILRS